MWKQVLLSRITEKWKLRKNERNLPEWKKKSLEKSIVCGYRAVAEHGQRLR